jgi:meso-butanediol dehydrogenase/(S,S)-butanediol dehydrogenase/diacetyl reductase
MNERGKHISMNTTPQHLQLLDSLDIPNLLKDKKIIVTGGGGAIGRATVLLLASFGAQVLAADRADEPLQQTRKAAEEKGLDVETFVADVSDEEAVRSLIDFTVQTFGGLTTICNNAAVNLPGDVESVSAEDFRTSMDVNVGGPFYMAKHSIPHLRQAGGGSIINTGSVNSTMAERQLSAYCTSKGAVLMLTRAIAVDYATEGIRANCLGVGFIDTPFNHPHHEKLGGAEAVAGSLTDGIPMGRGGEPEEIAAATAWLASDLATYVTGALIPIDGGLSAGF